MVNAATLNGRKIVTSDAYVLGEIEGVEVETETWTVTHLRVLLTNEAAGDLRLEKPIMWYVVISVPVRFIKAFGEPISLKVPFSEIAALKGTK